MCRNSFSKSFDEVGVASVTGCDVDGKSKPELVGFEPTGESVAADVGVVDGVDNLGIPVPVICRTTESIFGF